MITQFSRKCFWALSIFIGYIHAMHVNFFIFSQIYLTHVYLFSLLETIGVNNTYGFNNIYCIFLV